MTLERALERAVLALSFASSPEDAKAKDIIRDHIEYLKLLRQEALQTDQK